MKIKINIPASEMQEILWEQEEDILENKITDHSRWSVHHDIVFRYKDGHTYRTWYSVGATENQDERAWEYEDRVECVRVKQAEKTVVVWVDDE